METGYYAQNPRVIHETFRVGGQLTQNDIAEIDSTMVSRHCNGRDVYQLVKASRTLDAPYFVRDKRGNAFAQIYSFHWPIHRRSTNPFPPISEATQQIQFSVLNGDNVEIERILL